MARQGGDSESNIPDRSVDVIHQKSNGIVGDTPSGELDVGSRLESAGRCGELAGRIESSFHTEAFLTASRFELENTEDIVFIDTEGDVP